MSYLGKYEQRATNIKRFDVTGSTSATHTLTWVPTNEQSIIVTINGIKQHGDAYSVSGAILTLTSALVSTDKLEVIGIQDIGEGIVPADGVVKNVHINDSAAIAKSKLASLDIVNADVNASAAIALSKLATDPSNASNLASGTVPTARLGSGTADATTFLRGDQSWATAGGDNTPSFEAYMSTTMSSVGHGVTTKVDFDTVIFETNTGDFDTTNNRWTVPSGEGGKYLIFYQVIPDGGAYSNLNYVSTWIYKNGSAYMKTYDSWGNTYTRLHTVNLMTVMELSAADYLEVYVQLNTYNGSAGTIPTSSPKIPHFGGFKLL